MWILEPESIWQGCDMAVYSVPQILTYLNEVVGRDSLSQDLWVRGEVANLARPSSGHSARNWTMGAAVP